MFKKRAKGAEIILVLVAEKARAGPVQSTLPPFGCVMAHPS